MCDCIQTVNQKLLKYNTEIHVPWIGEKRPFVETVKVDEKKRGKPVYMFASYCPFCGEKYSSRTDILNEASDAQ